MFVQLTKEFMNKPAGERIDLAPADADTLILRGLAEHVSDDPLAPVVKKTMEQAMTRLTDGINGAVDLALKRFSQAQSKSKKNAVPAIFGEAASGDPKHSFGDWLLAVRRNDARYLSEEYQSHFAEWDGPRQKAAMNTGTGSQGGYTVPTEFIPRVLDSAAERAIVRPRATVIPMTSRSVQVPALDITTAPTAGDTSFFGGLVARWMEEAGSINETEPTFKQIELVAHELSGYSKVSNQLLADNAVGLEALLIRLFGGAIAWFEDYAFLRGDGVGKPLGVVGGAAGHAKSVTRNGAGAFALVDAAKMIGSLLPGWNPKTTAWVISPTVVQQVLQLGSTSASVNFLTSYQEAPKMQLLGFPIEVSEKLPALGTAKDVLLCDFQHYLVGDRQQIEIAYSEHVAFLNNQGVWRFVCRVDGQPWLRTTVTLSDASSTVAPYVYLT